MDLGIKQLKADRCTDMHTIMVSQKCWIINKVKDLSFNDLYDCIIYLNNIEQWDSNKLSPLYPIASQKWKEWKNFKTIGWNKTTTNTIWTKVWEDLKWHSQNVSTRSTLNSISKYSLLQLVPSPSYSCPDASSSKEAISPLPSSNHNVT